MKRKSWLEHEYAVTSWALLILPEIPYHMESELNGEQYLIIEKLFEWLNHPPCPNDKVLSYNMTNIIDIFWGFLSTGRIWLVPIPFFKDNSLLLKPQRGGIIHVMKCIFVTHKGTWTCSLQGNIQEVGNQVGRIYLEWCKTNQGLERSNLSGNFSEKRAILSTIAHLEQAQLLCNNKACHGDMFGDDGIR